MTPEGDTRDERRWRRAIGERRCPDQVFTVGGSSLPGPNEWLVSQERLTSERQARERAERERDEQKRINEFDIGVANVELREDLERAKRERDEALDEIVRTVNEHQKRRDAWEAEAERLREALKLARSIAECGEQVYAGDKAIFDAALAPSPPENEPTNAQKARDLAEKYP